MVNINKTMVAKYKQKSRNYRGSASKPTTKLCKKKINNNNNKKRYNNNYNGNNKKNNDE